MPPRPGKPCRFQSTQATLRTPIGQQPQASKNPVAGTHRSSFRNRTAGRVDAAAPSSPPRTKEVAQWLPEPHQQPVPIVDGSVVERWEQEVASPPGTFTDDVEDVYTISSSRKSWGAWSSETSVANALWEADTWSVQPDGIPPMFDRSELNQLQESRVDRTVQETDPQMTSSTAPVSLAAEDDPRRYRFHSALYSAAMKADIQDVRQILRTMSEEGLPPGPAALHSLVFAHVKAGKSQEALEAARNIVNMGLPLLEETYIALVYGLVEEGKVDLAEGVIMSMYNAGGATRNGWLALTKGLFRKGNNVTVAFQHLQKGLQEGWNPDASLFEYVVQAFCAADNLEQAQRVLASMPDLGCPPRTVHINLLVELVARLEGLDAALDCIQNAFAEQGQSAQYDVGAEQVPKAQPNSDTFCAVFRGILHKKGQDMASGTTTETFSKVTSAMMSADVFVGPKIMAYGLELSLMDGELASSLEQIASLRTVAGEGWTEYVDDGKLLALLTSCGSNAQPLDLVVLLRELERRQRHMPGTVLPTAPDPEGRPVSALTSWLPLPQPVGDERLDVISGSSGQFTGLHPVYLEVDNKMRAGTFSDKTARIIEMADIANYSGEISKIDVEVKPAKVSSAGEVVEPAVFKQVNIGIGKCAVTEDGTPMKVNSMLKVHLLAELQARGDPRHLKSKAAELKAEVKLQRDILEPHLDSSQQLDGAIAMSHVQSLVASGMGVGEALAQVRQRLGAQAVGSMGMDDVSPTSAAAEDGADEEQPEGDEQEDEFGIILSTRVIVTEYTDWQQVLRKHTTYGQLSIEERQAYRTMEKYTSPGSNTMSANSRRKEALETVMDDAQAQLESSSGWQQEAVSNSGLLSQFEGDLHLGEGDEGETSLSDGVGAPHEDSSGLMMAAGDAEDSPGVLNLEAEDDTDEEVQSEEDDDGTPAEDDGRVEASGEERGSGDESDSVHGVLLDDGELDGEAEEDSEEDTEEDPEEDPEESNTLLDLTGITNDSAGVEVVIECLRCARRIGLVISRGDFENTLAAASILKHSQYIVSLHGWAIEQATEVLTAAELDGADAATVRTFTGEFCEMARKALLSTAYPSAAVTKLMENEKGLSV